MAHRVAIRADASTRIGTGHIRRMRSLASALQSRGAEVRLFSRALGIDTRRIAGDVALVELAAPSAREGDIAGSPPHAAWAGIGQAEDATEFAQKAAPFDPDWVIVDHYAFDARWHDAVRGALACRVAVIDDVADRPLSPDLLVDHNLHDDHRRKYAGLLTGDPIVLWGPRHALIDPVFAHAPRCQVGDAVDRIGLFLGGADPADVTSTIFTALRKADFSGHIGVVTSSANPNLASLAERIAADPRATLAVDLPDLAAFFAWHDLQIGAGGGATWERLCIGAPSILLALADNQHDVLGPLQACGVAIVLPPTWRVEHICAAVRDLTAAPQARRAMSERAREMVDGLGTMRIADALLRLGGAA